MRSMLHRLYVLTTLLSLLLLPHPLRAEEPAEIVAHLGRYSILDPDKGVEVGFEARFRDYRFRHQPAWIADLRPMIGTIASAHGSLYAYAGFGLDVPLGLDWMLRPSWAAGFFQQHRELNLGGPLEFRSALELTRRINRSMRVGLSFYHLSNAGLYRHNPGSESLVLSFVARP